MSSENRERQRRRKVALACEPCRERKSRCDGRKPICSTCEHRSLGLEQCIYKAGNARTACSDEYTKALHDRIRHLERLCVSNGVDISAAEGTGSASNQLTVPSAKAQTEALVRSPSVLAFPDAHGERRNVSAVTSPEGVENPDGGSVTALGAAMSEEDLDGSTAVADDFYGSSSAASFLKEATSSMRTQPAGFSQWPVQIQTTPSIKNGGVLKLSDVDRFMLPPRALADHFVERYYERVYYLYPFFDWEAFERSYQSLWQPEQQSADDSSDKFLGLGLGSAGAGANTIVFQCALNSVFSLGSCFSDLTQMDRTPAMELFFNRSKSFVSLDFLDQNNLAVVQALLIMSLVLQGTPFPQRYWNAVGVACRVAHGLGLHSDASRTSRSIREKEVRQRTWHGCVFMDILVSTMFGRPTMTSSLSIPPDTFTGPPEFPSDHFKFSFHTEGLRLIIILEGILHKIYQPWKNRAKGQLPSALPSNHSLDTILDFDGRLVSFEKTVPPHLSWITPAVPAEVSATDKFTLELHRNVLHATFLYMKLILHRPILTQLSTPEYAMLQGYNSFSSDGLRYSFALESGRSCVEAAKHLIVLVHDTYLTTKTTFWWWNELYVYTAGLVLIVARLCPALWSMLDQDDIATLWGKCQSILQHQASFSAPARKSLALLLKVKEHISQKQAEQQRSTANENGHTPEFEAQQQVEPVILADKPFQEPAEMLLPMDMAVPSYQDTYSVGALFNWDQTFDFLHTPC